MVYLTREFHLDQVHASNILNMWGGITNFAPLLGAFISDTYTGRFKAIAFGSFFSLLVKIFFFILIHIFLYKYNMIIIKVCVNASLSLKIMGFIIVSNNFN